MQAGLRLGVIDAGVFGALLLASFAATLTPPPSLRRALGSEAVQAAYSEGPERIALRPLDLRMTAPEGAVR